MVYRSATDASEPANIIENEAGKWEWKIVDLNDGEGPPAGWKSLPVAVETVSEPDKPKRRKKAEADPVEDTPDGDGN